MRSVVSPGNVYYGLIEQVRCKAVVIQQCQDSINQQTFYLVAVPADDGDERCQQIRDPEGIIMYVKVLAVPRMNMPRTPRAGMNYRDWGERTPSVAALTELLKNPEALPARVNNESNQVEVMLSETETGEPPLDQQYETNLELTRLFAPVSRENDGMSANRVSETNTANDAREEANPDVSAAILDALSKLNARMERLESPPPLRDTQQVPRQNTGGAFDDLEEELDRATNAVPSRVRSSVPAPPQPLTRAQTPPVASSLDPAMVEWMKSISEAVVSRQSTVSASQAQLFKLHGAKGRVAQDELNRNFDRDPGAVIEMFETAVVRRAGGHHRPGVGGSGGVAATDVLLDAWRQTVPAREAHSTARIGEAVIDAYCAIRRGDPARGAARLALLIGAMEQSVLDNYRWHPRASTMTGMPPLPLQLYQTLPAEAKKGQDSNGKKLGEMAQLCDPVRSTTALAVYKDTEA